MDGHRALARGGRRVLVDRPERDRARARALRARRARARHRCRRARVRPLARREPLRASDDAELAGIAAKIDREEVYHRIHAEMWADRLLASNEGRPRLEEALDELWPYALGVLAEELRPELVQRVEAKLGRTMSD